MGIRQILILELLEVLVLRFQMLALVHNSNRTVFVSNFSEWLSYSRIVLNKNSCDISQNLDIVPPALYVLACPIL
jgi:hypothetical protein